MNPTLHIFKKDAKAFRALWLAWIALTLVQIAMVAMVFHPEIPGEAAFVHSATAINVVSALWGFGCYLLTAGVLLQDPPVGTRAFWLTRPISGSRMMGAKALWVIVFVAIIPALLWVPWDLYCGFGAKGLSIAFCQYSLLALAAAAPAAILATLSGDGPRFMLYSLVFAAVVAALVAIIPAESERGVIHPEIPALLLLAFGFAGAVTQFLCRRRWVSAGLAAFGVVAAVTVATAWPRAGLGPYRPSTTGSPLAAVVGAEIGHGTSLIKLQDGRAYALSLHLQLSGVPEGIAISTGSAGVSLEWPDGKRLQFDSVRLGSQDANWSQAYSGEADAVAAALKLPNLPYGFLDAETRAKYRKNWEEGQQRMLARDPSWKVRPAPDLSQTRRTHLSYALWIPVDPDAAARISASPPKCVVSADIFLVRPVIVGTLPLDHPNSEVADGARVHVLSSVEGYNPRAKARFMGADVVFDSAPDCPLQFFGYDSRGGMPYDIWTHFGPYGSSGPVYTRPNLGYLTDMIPAFRLWRTDRWIEDPGWRASARIAVVRFEPAGSFNRVVETESLNTKEPQPWADP